MLDIKIEDYKMGLRYPGGKFDLRRLFIKFCAFLQKKTVLILDSDPQSCARVLASSDRKGTFVEHLFAIPAWRPIYSVESEDGKKWEQLSQQCAQVLANLPWKERLQPALDKNILCLVRRSEKDPDFILDSEILSRLTLQTLFEVLFQESLSQQDEDLFFRASIEWRKEIAVKGKAKSEIKEAFSRRFLEILQASEYKLGFEKNSSDQIIFLSVFAQPFILSPQINISDILVAVWDFIRKGGLHDRAYLEAQKDSSYLNGLIMESIRLRHPFPVLERELTRDLQIKGVPYKSGTQVLILFDEFKQDQDFKPERWEKKSDNPYFGMPFGSGKRMCLGSALATALLQGILKSLLLSFPQTKVQPDRGHQYSGRHNDSSRSFAESFYQIKVFFSVLWRSRQIGKTKGTCPFH